MIGGGTVIVKRKGRIKSFLNEKSRLGNFEIKETPRTGPGENGKAHRLKGEQKEEEDRLKGKYSLLTFVRIHHFSVPHSAVSLKKTT